MRNRNRRRAQRGRSHFIQSWEDGGDEEKETAIQSGSSSAHGQRRGRFSSQVNRETEGRTLNAAIKNVGLELADQAIGQNPLECLLKCRFLDALRNKTQGPKSLHFNCPVILVVL